MVGPVVDLNIPTERESNKGRGFAFCEFPDHELALSAIKNLNGDEMKKRQIRVNFTSNEMPPLNSEEKKANLETSLGELTLQEKFFLVLQLKDLFYKDRERC